MFVFEKLGNTGRVSLMGTFLACFLLPTFATSANSTELTIKVTVSESTPSGTSHDGMRLYFLPWETSSVNPPDLAICVFQDSNDPICLPSPTDDEAGFKSKCPDTPTCSFIVDVDHTVPIIISIFDLDALGQVSAKKAIRTIDKLSEYSGYIKSFTNGLSKLNRRRWSWIESVILTPIDFENRSDTLAPTKALTRDFIANNAPPQLFDIREGRLAAPFATMPYENCLEPGPGCPLNYVTFSLVDKNGVFYE